MFDKAKSLWRAILGKPTPRQHWCIYREMRVAIYNTPLRIFIADDLRPWEDLFPQAGALPVAAACTAFVDGVAYVGFKTTAGNGTIAHEACHLAHFILHHVGIEHSEENDEPEAYLLGEIVMELHRTFEMPAAWHKPVTQ